MVNFIQLLGKKQGDHACVPNGLDSKTDTKFSLSQRPVVATAAFPVSAGTACLQQRRRGLRAYSEAVNSLRVREFGLCRKRNI